MIEELRQAVRDVEDFPKPGIVFKDITPILAEPRLFGEVITQLAATAASEKVDRVVGIDARGFIFAAAVADRLGVGFVPIRKRGKLPWRTIEESYTLEYGEAVVEIHEDALQAGHKVLLVDDLLATGGTAAAACNLISKLGAHLIAASFFIELSSLAGRTRLPAKHIHSILCY